MRKKNSLLLLVSLVVWCCFAFGQVQAAVSEEDADAASQLVATLISDGKTPAEAVTEALEQYPGAYEAVVSAALRAAVSRGERAAVVTAALDITNSDSDRREVDAGIKSAGFVSADFPTTQQTETTTALIKGKKGNTDTGTIDNTGGSSSGGGGGGDSVSPS